MVLVLKALSSLKTSAISIVSRLYLIRRKLTVVRSVSYAEGDGRVLDIYKPKIRPELSRSSRSLIVVHGGGWVIGDKRATALYCIKLAESGNTVYSINYRLAPKHSFPAAVEDCVLAINWVKKFASKYDSDMSKLYVLGESSGAHIVSLAVSAASRSKRHGISTLSQLNTDISGLILCYGVYNLTKLKNIDRPFLDLYLNAFLNGHSGSTNNHLLVVASPTTYIDPKFPRTLLVSSEVDPLNSQTLALHKMLQKQKVTTTLRLLDKKKYSSAKHGFLLLPMSKASKAALADIENFLVQL